MLFSPHQVSGAPTPAQSLSQGALGQMARGSGGGVGQGIAGGAAGNQDIQQRLIGGLASPGTATEDVKQQIIGSLASPGTVTEHVRLDTSDSGPAGERSARSFGSSFKSGLAKIIGVGAAGGIAGLLGGLLGGGGKSGGGEAAGTAGQLAGGIGPGIGGISGMGATIAGGAGLALAALPAAGALLAGGGVAAGGAALLIATNAKLQAQAKSMLAGLQKTMTDAASPLIKPLESAFAQIPKFMSSIAPALKSLFAGAAPLLAPMISGLEMLVKGLLPGLISLVKAAGPAFSMFAGVLGTLGHDLGGMFSAFAGAVKPSSEILGDLLDVVGGLLPVIGKVAAVLAAGLAPAFTVMAAAVKALEPVLTIVGKIFAEFASAVIGDLAGALSAVALLIKDMAPSFQVLAKVLGSLFTTLENTGAFAILGDALESMAKPLSNFVNVLVRQLAPFLPVIIRLVSQLSAIIVDVLAAGFSALLVAAVGIMNKLPFLAPLIVGIIAAVKAWAIAQAILDAAMDANPIGLFILALAALVGAIVELVTHWKTIWGEIEDIASAAWKFLDNVLHNGIVKDILDVWSLGLIPLFTHWTTVWGNVQDVIAAFRGRLDTIIHSGIVTDLLDVYTAGLLPLFTHWTEVWGDVVTFTSGLPHRILASLTGLGDQLNSFAKNAVHLFLEGAESVAKSVVSWFAGFGKDILGALKDVLKVFSPSAATYEIGVNLMLGLKNGIEGGLGKIKTTVGAVGNTVKDWLTAALKATGGPMSWLPALEWLVQQESGGNPRAVDPILVDGEHATGLLQTLPSTFAEYATVAGGIYNPVANAVAAIRYIMATYGSPLNIPGMFVHDYGYDAGGWLQPGGLNRTGKPEAVLTPAESQAFVHMARDGGDSSVLAAILAELRAQSAIAAQAPRRTGQAVEKGLTGITRGAAYRALYGTR
jgi:hypothetical protein